MIDEQPGEGRAPGLGHPSGEPASDLPVPEVPVTGHEAIDQALATVDLSAGVRDQAEALASALEAVHSALNAPRRL